MLYGIIGILCIIILILSIRLYKKVTIEHQDLEEYKSKKFQAELAVEKLLYQKLDLQKNIQEQKDLVDEYNEKILYIQTKYREELNKKSTDLDAYFENQKQLRQADLDLAFEQQEKTRQENLNLKVHELNKKVQIELFNKQKEVAKEIEYLEQAQKDIVTETQYQQQRYEALLAPLQQYEKQQQEKLYYTIQVPDEYKEDINFLLTTVAQKVQHPDIINKLVWAEYVKPYIDQTFKRVGIEDKPGIYKLTSLLNGKCYIGKSTNMKKRIADHMKSVVGISTIADQAVHHVIAKEGYWNWTIEPILYCEKEKLNELEKYYIDFFKSQTFGYNKNVGGGG